MSTQHRVPPDPSTPKRSYRLKVTEAEFAKFNVPQRPTKLSSKYLPGRVEIGAQVPQIDEVPEVTNIGAWNKVKQVAEEFGVRATESMSPAEGRALANALRSAIAQGQDGGVRDTLNRVIDVCEKNKGLRVVG